ncbi:MAG TPA: flagellar hook-associated protein FlgL [Rudaea sp.]
MSGRISTFGMYSQALTAMLARQSEAARTQLQLSSNSKLLSASDDPVGAGIGVMLDRATAELDRYHSNATLVTNRLNLEETALVTVGDRLSRIRELAVEASNDSQSAESRADIVAELKQQYDGLIAAANSTDGNGRYLFAGSQDATAPFAKASGGVTYSGDQVQRSVDVSANVAVGDSDAGSDVFLRVRTGNGTFAARANPANAGSLVMSASALSNPAAWDGGTYTVRFDGAGNYQVTDASSTVVSSGAYTPGSAIQFRGVQLTFDGTPAAGDSFGVQPSPTQDLFATVQKLIGTASAPSTTPSQKAAQRNGFYASLEDLDLAETHVTGVRAGVGARLNTLDTTATERDAQNVSIKSSLSDLRDLDYAEAASRLSMQMTALQAAQQTFQKVQGSSLFDYLRG